MIPLNKKISSEFSIHARVIEAVVNPSQIFEGKTEPILSYLFFDQKINIFNFTLIQFPFQLQITYSKQLNLYKQIENQICGSLTQNEKFDIKKYPPSFPFWGDERNP